MLFLKIIQRNSFGNPFENSFGNPFENLHENLFRNPFEEPFTQIQHGETSTNLY